MESCTVNIHLKPKAKFNRCEIGSRNVVEIAVTSPPVDNKANEHLQKYLAELLRISKSSVTIIKGHQSKNKAVAIEGLSQQTVLDRLGKTNRK
ncbi:MAG: DUF167 domain-containing protein [Chitinispirillaceae bacterium]|nr:DUF167 domain-containing protein [Chitinispirillaceae bacterium]